MAPIPSGYATVDYRWAPAAAYREAMTTWAFSIAAWDEDVEAISDEWNTFFAAIGMPSSSFATGVTVKVGTSDPSAPLVYQFDTAEPGSGSGALLPPNTAMLVVKRTLLGGRKGRGRSFMPSPLEAQISNVGSVDSTFLGNYQDAVVGLIGNTTALLDATATFPFLLHSDGVTAPTELSDYQTAPVVASQRPRLVR